jgi:hypothetical protein
MARILLNRELHSIHKIFAYVNYFHSSDEASQIDWKIFSVHGVYEIQKENLSQFLIDF